MEEMLQDLLEVPVPYRGAPEQYYNRNARLIVLEGPRGPLLARYVGTVAPDAMLHRFHTFYPDDYQVYEGTAVPKVAPSISAWAFPAERLRDMRHISSGATPSPQAPRRSTGHDQRIYPGREEGDRRTIAEQDGIRISPDTMEAHFGGSGMAIDTSGIHLEGAMHSRQPEKRGVTAQSPLFGLLPKTGVTFWASDYLPDLESIESMLSFAGAVAAALAVAQRLVDLLSTMD